LRIEILDDLRRIDPASWNALVPDNDPFSRHGFLLALETSDSLGERTGWFPRHVLAWRGDTLVGAAPAYLRSNSWGEFVFDFGWADASERAGIPYYPKITVAVPFTPATGGRVMAADPEAFQAVVAGLGGVSDGAGASSLHVLFAGKASVESLGELGFDLRQGVQYHWENEGYADFEQFLRQLRSKRRKEIRRERRQAQSGRTIQTLRAADLTAEHLAFAYRAYRTTVGYRGGHPYLSEAWFDALPMQEDVVLFLAHEAGEPVAMSLCFQRGNSLYGRYWGSVTPARALHFELCYYAPIEWAIGQGLERFEAGAQGEHKIARGFRPRTTYSAHRIRHPGLSEAVQRFLGRESSQVRRHHQVAETMLPFHRGERDSR